MSEKLRVGVVFGGRSAEHQVSLVSAQSIISALNREKYEVLPIGITPDGQWLTGRESVGLLKDGKISKKLLSYFPPDPTEKQLLPKDRSIQKHKVDVLFPILHGTYGEDGSIQGLFELADIPYVGAGVLGSAVGMDKIIQKQVCSQAGIPVADYMWLKSIDWYSYGGDKSVPTIERQIANKDQTEICKTISDTLGFPVFIKPPNLGSSVGISKAYNTAELKQGIEKALEYDRKVLIEVAIPFAREIEISVLGNERPKASIAGEVVPSNEFYDYDAKYVDDASQLYIPANLPQKILKAMQKTAIQSVIACEAEGMSRVDFLLNNKTKKYYLNEINTLPGFTEISMYPKLWQASGLEYSELLDELIRLAIERHAKKSKLKTKFSPKKEWYKKTNILSEDNNK